MVGRGALKFGLALLILVLFIGPQSVMADGGHGTGITFPAGSSSSEDIDTTINFTPYHHWSDTRIKKDFNLLLSPKVLARIGVVVGDTQQAVDNLLDELDYMQNNEFGLPYHDFALVYNYFSQAEHLYGDPAWGSQQNLLFHLDYPDSQQNHVDLYLAAYNYGPEESSYGFAGVCPSTFWDFGEDSLSYAATYHRNSLQDYDGPNGLDAENPDWYKSGGACNVRFDHEFQHLCYQSNTGWPSDTGWPNEMLSSAAEYLSGVATGSGFFEPIYDVACDAGLIGANATSDRYRYHPFWMWRLFAAYLFHQFNPNESDYTDDLLYKWNSTWTQYESEGLTRPGLYALAKELENSPWDTMLVGTDGIAKLESLFRDWSISLCVNDSTLFPEWGDRITLGFKRGLSPYYDIGLFRDVDTSCCAANSRALPHEHVAGQSDVDKFTWIDSYISAEDSAKEDCNDCGGVPLTVAQKADPIDLLTWGADYILFKSDDLGTGGPYDLKVKIRGQRGGWLNPPPNLAPDGRTIQVTLLMYSSPDSIFRTADNLIDIRNIDINPDSAKANVTVCDFGGSVKAAVIIVGLVWNSWMYEGGTPEDIDGSLLWNYKYGYTVEKHWKSGAIPWNVAWFDSIHVNGDVRVGSTNALTIEPGTRVEFYPGDICAGGKDATGCELIIQGITPQPGATATLVAEGSATEPILFTSGSSSPAEGDWYGVRQTSWSSPFKPSYCKFEYARYPVRCEGDTSLVSDSMSVNHCEFSKLEGSGTAIYASNATVTVKNCAIEDTSGFLHGIYLSNSSGILDSDSILGKGTITTGILLSADSSVTVTHNTISEVYTGISASGGSLNSSHNNLSGFHNDGILVSGSTVNISNETVDLGSTGTRGIELTSTSSGTVSHNYITSSAGGTRYGIETSDYAAPVIEYNKIDGPKYGIKCTGNSSPQIAHNWIKNTTGNGLQFSGDAGATVRYTTIESFQGPAVSAVDYSIPDLGAAPDSGSNRIYTSQSFSYYVANLAQDPLSAEYNWWGTNNPSSKKFYGDVDYVPYDTLDPGTSYSLPLLPVVSPVPLSPYALQSYPNPFNPRTTIEYGVSEPGARVRVAVYDISGRLVRMLVNELRSPGRFSVIWDGKDERGEGVASGVYFYEVVIGDFRQAKKLVILR